MFDDDFLLYKVQRALLSSSYLFRFFFRNQDDPLFTTAKSESTFSVKVKFMAKIQGTKKGMTLTLGVNHPDRGQNCHLWIIESILILFSILMLER